MIQRLRAVGILWLCWVATGCTAAQTLTADHAPQQAGRHSLNLTVDGLERSIVLQLPKQYDGTNVSGVRLWPLVVVLHGGGGSAKATLWETGWADKADQAGFIAVFPNAAARNPQRRSSFALNPQLWNDGSERFYEGQAAVDDVRFLDTLVTQLSRLYQVDPGRIYLTGFSNGASMSFLAAARLPHRFAAIAPVAGACWIEPGSLHPPVSMLYITGTDDPLNLIEGGAPRLATGKADAVRSKPKPPVRESILKWVRALGLPEQPYSVTRDEGVSTERYGQKNGAVEVRYVTVEGLGHTWAGGRSILPQFMVGATSDKINATDLIWEFFQQHSR